MKKNYLIRKTCDKIERMEVNKLRSINVIKNFHSFIIGFVILANYRAEYDNINPRKQMARVYVSNEFNGSLRKSVVITSFG